MIGREKYGKKRKYPHMVGEDADTWNKFIDLFPGRFETVDYDFRVGKGAETPASYGENYRNMATMLSQFRIDVIGWNGERPTIIEVKGRGVISAIGQLEGYAIHFQADFPRVETPRLMLVCDWISRDAWIAFEKLRIEVVAVGKYIG